jgi:hypothetical protein
MESQRGRGNVWGLWRLMGCQVTIGPGRPWTASVEEATSEACGD